MMQWNISRADAFASITMIINFNPVAVIYRIMSPTILCMIQSAYKYSTVLWINSTRPPAMSHYRFLLPWSNNIARHNGLYYVRTSSNFRGESTAMRHSRTVFNRWTARILTKKRQFERNRKLFFFSRLSEYLSSFILLFQLIKDFVVSQRNAISFSIPQTMMIIFLSKFLHNFSSKNKLKLNWEKKKGSKLNPKCRIIY